MPARVHSHATSSADGGSDPSSPRTDRTARVLVNLGFPGGSTGKESACSVGDLGSIPGLGRSPGEGKGYPLQYSWAFLVTQLVKRDRLQCRRPGFDPWVGKSPGEGKGYPLQDSGLENPMDCIDHGVMKSRTRLSESR